MSVDIAASTGEGAWVKGDTVSAQGLYYVPPHSGVINEAITAADATNPRNDLVILEALDDTHAAGGLNKSRVRVVTGTPTAGATRTDAEGVNGTPTRPDSAALLVVVNVPAGATSVTDSNILDRRAWARGTLSKATSSATFNATSRAEITGAKKRVEFSGGSVLVFATAELSHSAAGGTARMLIQLDGSAVGERIDVVAHAASAAELATGFTLIPSPAAGSHEYRLTLESPSGTATAGAGAEIVVMELVRDDASND